MLKRLINATIIFLLYVVYGTMAHAGQNPGEASSVNPAISAADCVNGSAGGFPCNKVDLLSHIALDEFSSNPQHANDIWGFYDLNTEREYALIGLENGVAIVDVSNPSSPFEIDTVAGASSTWRDIKVYQFFDETSQRFHAFAYVTTDNANIGLRLIDLSGLPHSVSGSVAVSPELSAHNVYITNLDYTTNSVVDGVPPVLYTAGSNLSNGRIRAYALDVPTVLTLTADAPVVGSSHDLSSVTIRDARINQCPAATTHCVLLIDANEDNLQIWDATNPANPVRLSSTLYAELGFVHSAWFTRDGNYAFVQDELDELDFGGNTRLRIFDMSNLAQPVLAGTWTGTEAAIDHNGFVRGNRYYMANYTRGLTILDISNPVQPVESGFFDTFPANNFANFAGAWGVYPYLPSGNLLLSDINGGLFVLQDRTLDSAQGTFSITATAGASEGSTLQLTVSRSGGNSGAVSVAWDTQAGSASILDFVSAGGVLSWADGDATDRSIAIGLTADGINEDPERFFVRLFQPEGGASITPSDVASAFISDAGAPSSMGFAAAALQLSERDSLAIVMVNRRGGAEGALSVQYQTIDISATGGTDYTTVSGQLDWADGDATARSIEVPILADSESEGDEDFQVMLSAPSGGTLTIDVATITIQNAANSAPSANAGFSQTVQEGTTVVLDGSSSSDPDGDPITFAWLQTIGPSVTLSNPDSAISSFVAPQVSASVTLNFQLTVTDSFGGTSSSLTAVTVTNTVTGGGGGGGSAGTPLLIALLIIALWIRPKIHNRR
ncbi:MAG: choice-of-anchor B family protein [Proteobacteria bacterium]|nr:choice-of-anchor B family protein [Pseudomonadota bacterium]